MYIFSQSLDSLFRRDAPSPKSPANKSHATAQLSRSQSSSLGAMGANKNKQDSSKHSSNKNTPSNNNKTTSSKAQGPYSSPNNSNKSAVARSVAEKFNAKLSASESQKNQAAVQNVPSENTSKGASNARSFSPQNRKDSIVEQIAASLKNINVGSASCNASKTSVKSSRNGSTSEKRTQASASRGELLLLHNLTHNLPSKKMTSRSHLLFNMSQVLCISYAMVKVITII